MDITTIEQISERVRDGVTDWTPYGEVKQVEKGDLVKLCYTNKARHANRWNWFECQARGIIFRRSTGELVARPLPKFFNWGEGGRTTDAEIACFAPKIDGSLGIAHRDGGEWFITTKGSFDSPQAQWATDHFREHYASRADELASMNPAHTLVFEIVYPGNRIVVDYGDTEALFLLDCIHHDGSVGTDPESLTRAAEFLGCPVAHKAFPPGGIDLETIASICKQAKNDEGFVVTFKDGQRFKFKTTDYLMRHRATFGTTQKSIAELIYSSGMDAALEVANLASDEARVNILEWTWFAVKGLSRLNMLFAMCLHEMHMKLPHNATRKERAMWIMGNGSTVEPALFAWLSGKPVEPVLQQIALKRL